MLSGFLNKEPETKDAVFIAPDAVIIGAVRLAKDTSVWFGAIIRADDDTITIGEGSNIQDRAVLHTDAGLPLTIGKGVTIGHGAILHGCTIGDNCVIGMGAIVLNHACIGENSLVGAGSVVPEASRIPPCSLVVGNPATVKQSLKEIHVAKMKAGALHYIKQAAEMKRSLSPAIPPASPSDK